MAEHLKRSYMISYWCVLVLIGLPHTVKELQSFKSWVTLTVTLKGHSRSNLMAHLKNPHMTPYQCLTITMCLSLSTYEIQHIEHVWPLTIYLWLWSKLLPAALSVEFNNLLGDSLAGGLSFHKLRSRTCFEIFCRQPHRCRRSQ